jgi:hypothetical protein
MKKSILLLILLLIFSALIAAQDTEEAPELSVSVAGEICASQPTSRKYHRA